MTIRSLDWQTLILPWLTPLCATALSWAVKPWFAVPNLAMLYLVAVLVTAVTTRTGPALICAALSFVSYNYFLTEPYLSLEILHREDLLTGLMLIIVALVTGPMAARLKEQLEALRASESWSTQQTRVASRLSSEIDSTGIVTAVRVEVALVLGWHVTDISESNLRGSPVSQATDIHCVEDTAGLTISFLDAQQQPFSVLRASANTPIEPWHRDRVETILKLAKLAWVRVQLSESLRDEILQKEREQLRSALLSSVSHDLRTPLATMIGSVSSLIDLADSLDKPQREELLQNTLSEARRLERYIQKLLDMTRLGNGELTLDRDWIGLDDIVNVVRRRVQPLLAGIALKVELPADLPLLHVHPALIEQAIFNVLENAIRFSPPDSQIELQATCDNNWIHVDIHDAGPGISEADRERVFDMFHSVSSGDHVTAGTGLGLTICKSFLAAHGGDVVVLPSTESGGTTFRISLPVTESGPVMQEDEQCPKS